MRNLLFVVFAFISITSLSAQVEVAGINLPQTITYGQHNLNLNGVGVREKFWMDMYAGGLYLESESGNAQGIINADDPMAIRLHIVSKMITSKRMLEAINEGFEKATDRNTAPIKREINNFKAYLEEKINKNDVFDFIYLPSRGLVVLKNNRQKGLIEGMEFKKALFRIWLGEDPADEALKEAMLAR